MVIAQDASLNASPSSTTLDPNGEILSLWPGVQMTDG